MAKVVAEHVYKRYGDVAAVKDFSLEIQDQEFLVLVGPSGCGKTTTLRMVAGLEEISDGVIRIGERVVNDVAPKDRDIAMVFQNYALYPHMNVYDNMAFGLKLRHFKRDEIDRRVKEAADILGIGPLLKRKPKELSGGQRQRVALGRAIVREPQAFLMDEPLSNLDAKLRVQTRTELKKLHNRLRTTVIYVTHDQTEAMTMGDRIVVMRDGVVQQVATPHEVYTRPSNQFVAGFIGSPAMNLLAAKLQRDGGTLYVVGDGFRLPIPQERVHAIEAANVQNVTFGIRPENLSVEPQHFEQHPDWVMDTQVDVVEPMGSETFLYLSVGGQSLTARVESDFIPEAGQAQKIGVDMVNMHIFDAETQVAIR